MHLSTPSEALKNESWTSSESGSTLRAMRNGLLTNGADVGIGFGVIAALPMVCAIGVGVPAGVGELAGRVGWPGVLTEPVFEPPQAASIRASDVALAPMATSRRNCRRSSPLLNHSSNSAP